MDHTHACGISLDGNTHMNFRGFGTSDFHQTLRGRCRMVLLHCKPGVRSLPCRASRAAGRHQEKNKKITRTPCGLCLGLQSKNNRKGEKDKPKGVFISPPRAGYEWGLRSHLSLFSLLCMQPKAGGWAISLLCMQPKAGGWATRHPSSPLPRLTSGG